jgi:cytochrome c biogenesis protein CcmG/thiol:disulfide interchange protein DsbE
MTMHDDLTAPASAGTLPEGAEAPSETEEPGRGRGAGIAVFVGLLVACVAVVGIALAPRGTSSDTSIGDEALKADPVGQQAPDFTAKTLDGSSFTLSSLRGKVVVVNFWASWCSTCKTEAADVAATEKKWRAKGVQFVGIDEQDTPQGAAGYNKQYGIEFPSAVDADLRIKAHYNVTGLPETFVIDPQGVVVAKYISVIDPAVVDQQLAAMVSAAKAA